MDQCGDKDRSASLWQFLQGARENLQFGTRLQDPALVGRLVGEVHQGINFGLFQAAGFRPPPVSCNIERNSEQIILRTANLRRRYGLLQSQVSVLKGLARAVTRSKPRCELLS